MADPEFETFYTKTALGTDDESEEKVTDDESDSSGL